MTDYSQINSFPDKRGAKAFQTQKVRDMLADLLAEAEDLEGIFILAVRERSDGIEATVSFSISMQPESVRTFSITLLKEALSLGQATGTIQEI